MVKEASEEMPSSADNIPNPDTGTATIPTPTQHEGGPARADFAPLAELVHRGLIRHGISETDIPAAVERANRLQAEERQAELMEARIKALQIPELYRDSSFTREPAGKWVDKAGPDNLALWRSHVATMRRWLKSWGIVALIGPRGSGKTDLAWGALKEAAGMGLSALHIKAADLFIDIEGTWGRRSQESPPLRAVLNRLIRPRVLAIDELSEMQADKDWQSGRLTYILDKRYEAKLCTLLISNDKQERFYTNLGESAVSRMRERGTVLKCEWPSMREYRPV